MKEIRMLEDLGGDWPKVGGTRRLPDGQADYLVLTKKAEPVEAETAQTPNPSAETDNKKESK